MTAKHFENDSLLMRCLQTYEKDCKYSICIFHYTRFLDEYCCV